MRNIFPLVLALAGLSLAPALRAEELRLDHVIGNAEAQRGDLLCWAASSVTVVNSVINADGSFASAHPVRQLELAAHQSKAIRATPKYSEDRRQHWSRTKAQTLFETNRAAAAEVESCTRNPQLCDLEGVPMLLDLKFTPQLARQGTVLSWCELTQQLRNQRPVLFGWKSVEKSVTVDGSIRTLNAALHFLVAVGFRATPRKQEVLIWDPWPNDGRDGRVDGTEAGGHLHWIDYALYANPANGHWGAQAVHQYDRFDFRKAQTTWAQPVPALAPTSCTLIPTSGTVGNLPLSPISMERIREEFSADRVVATAATIDLPPLVHGQSFGTAMPVLALSRSDIVNARGNSAQLLRDEVSSVLLPVMEGDEVVASYLLLRHGQRWNSDGYAGLGLTRQIVATRKRATHGSAQVEQSTFLISIPSRREFFVALQGGPDPELFPTFTQPHPCLKAGSHHSAKDYFNWIDAAIARDEGWARRPGESHCASEAELNSASH